MWHLFQSRRAGLLGACCVALLAGSPVSASGHARVHAWVQEHGNLVLNWSFENPLEFWRDDSLAGVVSRARVASGDAVSGRFTGMVSGAMTTGSVQRHLETPLIPVVPGQAYTLSFWVRSDGEVAGGAAPEVRFWEMPGVSSGSVTGVSHRARAFEEWGAPELSWWTLQRLTFTVPSEVTRVSLALWRAAEIGAGGTLHFDDVVLEEGTHSDAEVLGRRAMHNYAVSYHDALGRWHQTQSPAPENISFLRVEGVEYDSAGRVTRVPVASAVQSPWPPAFIDDLIDAATWFHETSNPYSETVYAQDPLSRVMETASPGEAWALSAGRTRRFGQRFVGDLSLPASIETASPDPAERPYLFAWARDEDSVFTMTWTNRRGEVVQEARQFGADPAQAPSFAVTRTEYTPAGMPRRVLTPLDIAASGNGFAEIRNHDARGMLTSRFGPDVGLEKFWYDREGKLRYAQGEEQRERGTYFTYYDYDAHGNLVSTGEQFLYNPPYPDQDQVVDPQGELGVWGKEEHRGFLYGGISAFEERTGIHPDSLGWGLQALNVRPFALAAAWHRNPRAAEHYGATAALVSEFPHYDTRGRVISRHLWLGMSAEASLQSVSMAYDSLGRLRKRILHEGLDVRNKLMEQGWTRDAEGRVVSVSGFDGVTIARYAYAYDGRLTSVWMGEEEDDYVGIEIRHGYHVRGWLNDLEAYSRYDDRPIFRQVLGYEKRALEEGGVPFLDAPRYGGQVSQQLYWYLWDVANPLRVVNYTYDQMGRLTTADYRHGQGSFGYGGNLVFPVSFSDVNTLDTRVEYDLNGRIMGKRGGGVSSADSAVYGYGWNSYRVDHVTGRLSSSGARDAAGQQTFGYDASGRLLWDRSKGLEAVVSHEGLVTEYRVVSGDEERVIRPLYDASGYRVSEVTESRLPSRFPVYWAGMAQGAEPWWAYGVGDVEEAWIDANYRLNVQQYPAPDSLIVYMVADSGQAFVFPDTTGYGALYKDTVVVPLVIRGLEKYGATYDRAPLKMAGFA